MKARDLFGKGIAFPPGIGMNGGWIFSEGPENIRENIRIILLTHAGERLRLPSFGAGLRRFLQEPIGEATRARLAESVAAALARWEPRIRVKDVTVEADPSNPEGLIATVAYELTATGQAEELGFPLGAGA